MASDTLLTQIDDNILTVTINRPEKRNAMTQDMLFDFADLFKRANADDNIKCIVVTGAGDYFCSGFDISGGGGAFAELDSQAEDKGIDWDVVNQNSPGSQIGLSLFGCYKPIIAAINGSCAGVGATMLLPMDFRLATEGAKIGFVFTRRGVVPEAGSTWFLPRIVGMSKASDWLITGRLVEASEALDAGLLNSVHKSDELLTAAYSLARDIVENTSSVAVACTRQLLLRMLSAEGLHEATALESALFAHLGNSPDAVEGVRSFLEKRPPSFLGKVSMNMPPQFPWWK
jgi:enoyl-CoA hydratase/carnithine racemase